MITFSGKNRVDPEFSGVFSGEGIHAFDPDTGDRVWIRRGVKGFVGEALVEECSRCGEHIGEVRSANFPGLSLCQNCFGKWVDVCCVTPPAHLAEGYGGEAMALNDEDLGAYIELVSLDTTREERDALLGGEK